MRFKNLILPAAIFSLATPVLAGANPMNDGPKSWKAVFMTGDNSIPAFDNAREAVTEKWRDDGLKNIGQLSMNSELVSKKVLASSAEGLDLALRNLRIKPDEGCLIWLTSHGNETGLYMRDQAVLSPETLGAILDKRCKNNPTVLIVSACHSGTFLALKNPNRVILTAAKKDRKSFGCSIKYEYTFFDQCLLKYYSKSKTFEGLFIRANLCIKNREAEEEATPPSMPQVYVGKQMKFLKIPRKPYPSGNETSAGLKKAGKTKS